MKRRIDSLRLRLVLSMTAVFALGVVVSVAAVPLEERALGSGVGALLDEPYQDVVLLLLLGSAMLVLIWMVAGWSLRHVAAASRQAAGVGPGNLELRIATDALPSEIRPLVTAFNDALCRLSRAYAAEQRFVADAAHELRTPISVLSLRVQRARDGALDWAAIEGDVDRVNRLAGQLLDLAQKSHLARTVPLARCALVDLARIGREAAADAVPVAERAGRVIAVDLPRHMVVRGRAEDLRDLLRNLIDNALKHGGGTISLAGVVEHVAGVDWARIVVSDEGPGVPPGLEDAVFERFRKAEPSSDGHGLGLAIVRETAEMHDGVVEIAPGPGCRVHLRLRLAGDERHAAPIGIAG